MEQINQAVAAAVNTDSAITQTKATIKIEGQEFELETVLAKDDKMLKTILQFTRETKDGKLIVTIVKRAQHKGA